MIPEKLIEAAKKQAYSDSDTYGTPTRFNIDLSVQVAQRLVFELNANKNIVVVGSYLADCMLGHAISQNSISKHIEFSRQKANEIISRFPEVSPEEKENILQCVSEHHGKDKFYSLESEIVCNADCYRFASVQGFLGSIRYFRDMEMGELVKLLGDKADEKWNALSLDICKKELEPQYKVIKSLIDLYK